MLRFVLRKMINKKWMVCALLIGNILLIGITCSNPMYTQAILQRTLTRSLARTLSEKNSYPGTITVRANTSIARNPEILATDETVKAMPGTFGVEALEVVSHFFVNNCRMESTLEREVISGKNIAVGTLSGLEAHSSVVMGRRMSDDADADGVIEAMVSERALIEQNLMLDEVLELGNITDENENPVRVKVVGVFTNSRSDDAYWVRTPSGYSAELLIPEAQFTRLFMTEGRMNYSLNGLWYVLLDYTRFTTDNAQAIYDTAQAYTEQFKQASYNGYRDSFSATLADYLKTEKQVRVTLLVLQAPIFVLLAAFIFMVSRQMLEMEQAEIAVIKSRGASRRQLLSIYLIESGVLAFLGLCAGVPLGFFLTQVLGSSNAFLEFVKRTSLDVRLDKTVWLYALGAALFSVAAMVLPVFRYSRVTIVAQKQKKHRSQTPFWQKAFLDVIALGVSLYGLYTFNNQRDALAQRVLEGASLDPLLFLSSSLFMIGAGLFAVRLIPALVYVIFRLFRKWWSPALYVSYLRVLRTRSQQSFIMVFLIMTIALGVFNADAARTINSGEENNIRYATGADLVLQEQWASNEDQVAEDPSLELVYTEPDFGRYQTLEGARSVTRVLRASDITVSLSGGTLKNVDLMGIHTREFGETAWFDESLLPRPWHEYLNALAQNSRAVLLSKNFRDQYGYHIGDSVNYRNKNGDSMRGIVYGFVDYWPAYQRYTYSKGNDGVYKQTEHFLIVANLSQLQAQWGVTPYEVWIKTNGSSQFIYDFAQENGVEYLTFKDVAEQLVEKKNDPIFQGTNGILTVGFIVVLLLCMVGFLIYWVLSIRSRALQFGIFRAMGMSMREILTMLINEHFYISALSIAVGVLVGEMTSRLYMPLIQMAYAASDSSLPLRVVSEAGDLGRILLIVGVLLAVCLAVLGTLISRMKIAQALKLGED